MILEYKLDYRSSSSVYEKIFLNQLKASHLNGNISKDGFELKLFVEAETPEELETFATSFATNLPHSIFLYSTEAQMVDTMPKEPYRSIENKTSSFSLCPTCLNTIKESSAIFTQCDMCENHNSHGENRSYKSDFMETAQKIQEGKTVEINTFYGKYFIGTPSAICNSLEFDILAYDLATVEQYANVEAYELNALASFEKPKIRLKTKLKFTIDHEDVNVELIKFRLADDAILSLLMQELHTLGIDALFITKDRIDTDETLLLTTIEDESEPIEVVVSANDVLIVKDHQAKSEIEEFNRVVKNNNLLNQYENFAGVNLNRDQANIIVHGKKFGLIEYFSFETSFDSVADIFTQIVSTGEQGKKLLENYRNKFPEHYDNISTLTFEKKNFSIYTLWGVIAIILDFAQTTNPQEAAKILEESGMSFLGDRGVKIDYKLISKKSKLTFNPLMTIQTAISFKLAGVDKLSLCYGIMESFVEFISNELDELKQTMNVEAVIITGSLLSNRKIFSKISAEVSKNHKLYFT